MKPSFDPNEYTCDPPSSPESAHASARPAPGAKSFGLAQYITNPPAVRVSKETGGTAHSFYGFDGNHVLPALTEWCKSAGVEGDIETHLSALLGHARETYFRKEQTCFWISIRITQSMDRWKIPRPHHDGRYWPTDLDDGLPVFKVGACIVGPGTLFWDAHQNDKEAQELVSLTKGIGFPDEQMRQWAAEELEKLGIKKVQPKNGEAAVWIVASDTLAGIHSEPDMSDMPDGRIFVSILPGTEEQIRHRAKICNSPFTEREAATGGQTNARL